MKKLTGESMNITEENLKNMQQLFPEAFEEGKIDFEVLRQLLGDFVDDEQERYGFKWNGKGRALRLSQTPSMGTLRPCKEESKDWDTTENLYIEGDNLEVLKLLQKSYYGKVKMIYIDLHIILVEILFIRIIFEIIYRIIKKLRGRLMVKGIGLTLIRRLMGGSIRIG